MAANRTRVRGRQILVAPTDGGVNSGDPMVVGQIPGVALYNKDANGNTVIDRLGVYNLSVKGANNAGNVAVAAGDIIYYNSAATPKLNKDSVTAGNVRFGYALAAITSGATATIEVAIGY